MARWIFLLTVLITGCDEFYDEEFEDFQSESALTTQDITYTAELRSTDPALSEMIGNATVDVRDDSVSVDYRLDNIPENIIQIHYSYLATDCDNLSSTLLNDTGLSRDFNASETTTTEALARDLASSGAATSTGDINLTGKSFVVKSFSNFSGIPAPGTNQLTIACGELSADESIPNIDIFTPEDPTIPDDRGDVGFEP